MAFQSAIFRDPNFKRHIFVANKLMVGQCGDVSVIDLYPPSGRNALFQITICPDAFHTLIAGICNFFRGFDPESGIGKDDVNVASDFVVFVSGNFINRIRKIL